MSNLDTTTEPTSEGLTVTPAVRFAAAVYANGMPYDGPRNLRVTIDTAAKVESFPESYLDTEVLAARLVLVIAGTDPIPAEVELAAKVFWIARDDAVANGATR